MNAAVLVLVSSLSSAVPEGQYGAAAFDAPADATPHKVLSQWDLLQVERGLTPDLVDHKAAAALGEWLSRPHVCTGMVRYHAVLAAEGGLRVFVVAECSGQGTNLDKAAQGLADELGKRVGARSGAQPVVVKDVPSRLWDLRVRRGNVTPPSAPGK